MNEGFDDCIANLLNEMLIRNHNLTQLFLFLLALAFTESVCVVTSDGRIILGELVGHDQVQNLILNNAKERVYAEGLTPELVELGLYVIRGDNVSLIADYNPDAWTDDAMPPLPPIQQHEKI